MKLITAFLMCAATTPLFAQDNKFKQVIPPSPTAASLGKYGEMPVGNHTGVPNISIPIHSVNEGEINVPITLSYHASGIKVEDLASWVGLGWSLSAGGVINRTVVGAPDEGTITRPNGHSDCANDGWYEMGGLPPAFEAQGECVANPDYMAGDPFETSCKARFLDAAEGIADTEPDVFSFNFAGYSGKFYFGKGRQVILQPQQDVVIKPTTDDFSGWTIITPDGITYSFGGPNATEKNYAGSTLDESMSSTSWYLTRIENFTHTHSVTFEYVPEKYSYGIRPGHSLNFTSQGAITEQFTFQAPASQTLISVRGVRLSKIITSSGFETIDFVANTLRTDVSQFGAPAHNTDEAKRLDAVKISIPTLARTFDFTYSYFTSDQTSSVPPFGEFTTDMRRLRLDELKERTVGDEKPSYKFFYETKIKMARRLSLARDHWGYYNGHDGNVGLIPSFTIGAQTHNTGVSREANEDKMKAWTLRKVVYPTGGFTEYAYEAHREGLTNVVGGLRIKEVKVFDGFSLVPSVKTYAYDFGRLYAGNPNYVSNTVFNQHFSLQRIGLGYVVNSSTQASLVGTQGYHIGYTKVSVEDGANGKSIYEYFNSTPGFNQNYPSAPTQYELGGGDLASETHLDAEGYVVRSTHNTYITSFSGTVNAIKVVTAPCLSSCGTGPFLSSYNLVKNYTLNIGRRLLITRTEYNDGVTTVTDFSYSPKHNQPIKITKVLSDGSTETIAKQYSKDRYVSSCSVNDSQCRSTYEATVNALWNNYIATFNACNQIAAADCESVLNVRPEDCTCCFPTVSSIYTQRWSVCKQNCASRRAYECITANQVKETYLAGILAAENVFRTCQASSVTAYDNCVASSMTTLNQEDRVLAHMIYGNLNAELEEKAFIGSLQTGGKKTVFDFHNTTQLLPTEFYQFNPKRNLWERNGIVSYTAQGNLKEFKKENDVTTSYVWGYNNQLPIAEVKNAQANQILYTSFEDLPAPYFGLPRTGNKGNSEAYTIVLPSTLPNGSTYRLSYWKKSGANWEHVLVENVTSNLTIGGVGITIDDVLLHPSNSMVTYFSYSPGIGMLSTSDTNGRSTFYSYDEFGRFRDVRDNDKNLVKSIEYHYKH